MNQELPWDQETIDSLNEYQRMGQFHPYTCNGGNDDFSTHHDHEVKLIATAQGWKCPECSRTQEWYHNHSKELAWEEVIEGSVADFLAIEKKRAEAIERENLLWESEGGSIF